MNKKFLFILVGGAVIILSSVVYTFYVIYHGVSRICHQAKVEYHKDCVDSLILYVQEEEYSFRDRNTAIWALGQIADAKALPVLEKYYTGNIPNKESLDKSLSQYELQKSIKWCKSGNITSWMYNGIRNTSY